ncbi:MAG: hypothetical protein R3B64_02925 [Candidatus Paceibacterota bacterium]|nr:hypothetical protein [Candidatus Nomurabacteria bacterium]
MYYKQKIYEMRSIKLNPHSLYILQRFLQSEGVQEYVTKVDQYSWVIQEPGPNTSGRSNSVELVYANSQVTFEGPSLMAEAYFQIFNDFYIKEVRKAELHQIETSRGTSKVIVYTVVALTIALFGIAYTFFKQYL